MEADREAAAERDREDREKKRSAARDFISDELATLMLDCFIKHHPGLKIRNFEFKAHHPVFDLNPFQICGKNPNGDNQAELWVQDLEKNLCMKSCVTLE